MPLYQFDPRLQAKLDKRGGGLGEALQAILAGYGLPEGGPRAKDSMFGLPEVRWLLSQGGLDPLSMSILQAILPNFGPLNAEVFQQAKGQAREGKQAAPEWMRGAGLAPTQTVVAEEPQRGPNFPDWAGPRKNREEQETVSSPLRAFHWSDVQSAPVNTTAAGRMQPMPQSTPPLGVPISGYGGLPPVPGPATLLPRYAPTTPLGGKPQTPRIGRFR